MTTIKRYFDLIMPEISLPEDREMLGDALRVKSDSSIEEKRAIRTIARFFKREIHLDAIMYAHPSTTENDDECYAYVFTLEKRHKEFKSVVIGGFCFRNREWGGYGLQWIWLHPYLRNTGLLTRNWKAFEDKFGEFYCEPPYTLPFQKFLDKENNKKHVIGDKFSRAPHWTDDVKK